MAPFQPVQIDPPTWATQPDIYIQRVTVADFTEIQRHRGALLDAVHREVEEYLNDPQLVFEADAEGFPCRSRLTGEFYVGSESYIAHSEPGWFQISVMCRFLEPPKPGMNRVDDYLGLELWLKCVPGKRGSFEVFRNTDSSSI